MGLFRMHGHDLEAIQQQIWYPNLTNRSQYTDVMRWPDFHQLYDEVLGHTDSIVEVFQLNKQVTGPNGVVAEARPGISARMPESGGHYEVHLPVKQWFADITSMAMYDVQLDVDTDPYKYGPFAGRVATAMAIQQHVLGNQSTNKNVE